MKQEIRFLDCIERDCNSRMKKSIILGIISVICFLSGIMVMLWRMKNITMDVNKSLIIMIIGAIIAWGPMIFSIQYILIYIRRRENRKDWNEITKKFSFNEEINVRKLKLKNHISENFESNMMYKLLLELLPDGDMKMIITQGEESDRQVKIIYMLSNGVTVTETFICFENDNVFDLMRILSIR